MSAPDADDGQVLDMRSMLRRAEARALPEQGFFDVEAARDHARRRTLVLRGEVPRQTDLVEQTVQIDGRQTLAGSERGIAPPKGIPDRLASEPLDEHVAGGCDGQDEDFQRPEARLDVVDIVAGHEDAPCFFCGRPSQSAPSPATPIRDTDFDSDPVDANNPFWPEPDRPLPALTIFMGAGLTLANLQAAAILVCLVLGVL